MGNNGIEKKTGVHNKHKFNILRFFEWIATLLLLFVFALAIIGFFPVSHPWITEKCINLIKMNGADSCDVSKVSVTVWHGIEFNNLSIKKVISEREQYSFCAGKVTFAFNFLKAVTNYRTFKNVSIDFLHEDLFCDLYKNPNGSLSEFIQLLNIYDIPERLFFEELGINIQRYDSTTISLKHGEIEMEQNKEKKQYEIKYQFGSFLYNSVLVENSKGKGTLNEHILKVTKASGKYLNGKYRMSGEIDIGSLRLRNGYVTFNELDLSSFITEFDTAIGKISGVVEGELKLVSSTFNRDSLQGNGVIILKDINIADAQVQNSISNLLGATQFNSLYFDKIKNDFILKKNLTFFNETQGFGSSLNFRSKGWVQPDGALNQEFKCDVSSKFAKELPPVIANSMDIGDKGERLFRCRIYGHLSSPRIELDSVILKRVVGNVFEDVRSNLKSFFNKKSSVE